MITYIAIVPTAEDEGREQVARIANTVLAHGQAMSESQIASPIVPMWDLVPARKMLMKP